MVLKQCGQVAITFRTLAAFIASMLAWAWVWYRYSLPMRRAGSPLQASDRPRMAKSTPAFCSSPTKAGATGHARPDLVLFDRLTDQLLRLLGRAPLLGRRITHRLEEVLAGVDDDHLGIERLAREEGRALLLAAAAFRAGVEVEEVLPGPLGDRADAVVLGVLEIDCRQLGADFWQELAKKDIGDGDDDVQVFRARDVDEEGQYREDVHPVEDLVRGNRRGALPAAAFKGTRDQGGYR